MNRPLVLCDSPSYTTSYANLGRNLGIALHRAGIDFAYGSFQSGPGKLWYTIPGTDHKVPHYGVTLAPNIGVAVEDFKPDVIIHVRDLLAVKPQYFAGAYSIKAHARGVPVWGWVPVQFEFLPWEVVDAAIREFDKILVFTESGRRMLGNSGMIQDRMVTLMPGVDPAYSNPEVPPEYRFGRQGVPMVMSVGEPRTNRKAFPLLARAYRNFVGRKDVDYYLHTAIGGQQGTHYQMVEHVKQLGVASHWIFPLNYNMENGIATESLARYYSRASVYASVGTGEGLNMPLQEACAMGLPVLYPDFPNNAEIVSDYTGPKFPVRTVPFPQQFYWEWLMDSEALAVALEAAVDAVKSPAEGRAYYARHTWDRTAQELLAL